MLTTLFLSCSFVVPLVWPLPSDVKKSKVNKGTQASQPRQGRTTVRGKKFMVSRSPPCRIKRQEYYPETERVCGALPGDWLPQLAFNP